MNKPTGFLFRQCLDHSGFLLEAWMVEIKDEGERFQKEKPRVFNSLGEALEWARIITNE